MLEKRFNESILKNSLCLETDRILVAVSGGKDSMALLHLFYKNGYAIEAAHFNFKLRGIESDLDEKLVRTFCNTHGIQLHVTSADTLAFAQKNKLSTQMAARELRYSWFKTLMSERKLDYIATAHHLNDNLETLLLHIAKGTGPRGLTGIPAKSNRIIRPLLENTAEEILIYMREEGIAWREDLSNQKNDYARNRIRNNIIPQLKIINPGLEQTVSININRFKDLAAIFREQLDSFESQVLKEGERRKISLELIRNTVGVHLLLEEYLKEYGFNHQDVSQLLTISHAGKMFLSSSHTLTLDRGFWLLDKIHSEIIEPLIIEKEGKYKVGTNQFSLRIQTEKPTISELKLPNYAFFDLDKIDWPLTIRVWKEGDKFKPFGMKGKSKLVSDYLIDVKQDLTVKKNQLVLLDKNKVLWIVGLRSSHDVKISENTQKILLLKFE
jgi:tRNA(Ile)-lysidine synthase